MASRPVFRSTLHSPYNIKWHVLSTVEANTVLNAFKKLLGSITNNINNNINNDNINNNINNDINNNNNNNNINNNNINNNNDIKNKQEIFKLNERYISRNIKDIIYTGVNEITRAVQRGGCTAVIVFKDTQFVFFLKLYISYFYIFLYIFIKIYVLF
eukprot:GHVR01007663.1.p1 GENE.GHVR01007663.1~~GHVR01007663.1.p1  ORF type:complete len:157 (+),score=49.05 GHVR01007663.1:15-485(+)